jgi:multiple sugar transport system permease protein
MIPSAVGLVPMYVLMTLLGWYNTYLALIIPGAFSAYTIFLMRQYIITIPNDILDAARLSGCSEFGLYWRIVLPLSKPAIAALGLVNGVFAWNDLLWPTLMIKNLDLYTVQMTLAGLWDIRDSAQYLNIAAGAITIATIPLLIFTIINQKYLLKGWSGLSYAKR